MNWLELFNQIQANAKIDVDENLRTQLTLENICLGLLIKKDNRSANPTATLTSLDCNQEALFMCSFPVSQITIPPNNKKLPCLPKKDMENEELRRKRAISGLLEHRNIGQVHGKLLMKL